MIPSESVPKHSDEQVDNDRIEHVIQTTDNTEDDQDQTKKESFEIADDETFERIAQLVAKANNLVCFSGAGMS